MVYATVHHFIIALKSPLDRLHMLFASMCLLTVPFALFHAVALQSANITDFVWALKWTLAAVFLIFLLFPWFIALHTGKRPKPFLAGLSVLFAVLFVVNLLQPYSLQYEHLDGLHTLHLPWGEAVSPAGTANRAPGPTSPLRGSW